MTFSLLQTAAVRLSYLGDVQNLLADNIANIDTPGYAPAGAVSFSDYLNGVGSSLPMQRNNPGDLPAMAGGSPLAATAPGPAEHSPDGNAVALDKQLVQIAKTETDQQLSANIYQSYMGMYKTALGTTP